MSVARTEHKIRLYASAVYLFDQGLSHPQIVDILTEYENDSDLLASIVNKAMKEQWDILECKARELMVEGKEFNEIIAILQEDEPDRDILYFICNYWDELKIEKVTLVNTAGDILNEGITSLVVSGVVFWGAIALNFGIAAKIFSGLGVIAGLGMILLSLLQRRLSRRIDKIMKMPIH